SLNALSPPEMSFTTQEFATALRRAWFPVALSADLSGPTSTRLLGVELVVFRDSTGRARVASNQCPHRGAALSMGHVVGDTIQCPYQGGRWDADGGRCMATPATGQGGATPSRARLDVYDAREEYGLVWTPLSQPPLTDPPHFEEFDELDWGA